MLTTIFYSIILISSALSFELQRVRLGIDYGPRIIGIAKSSFMGSVQPYGTIANTGDLPNIVSQILQLANSWSVSEIVLGIPLDSTGQLHYGVNNFNGKLCLNFSKVLSSIAKHESNDRIKTILFDERYTTKEAALRIKQERVRATLDSMSAACLLERYIEDFGEGSIEAEPCEYPPPPELANFDYNTVKEHIRSVYFPPVTRQRGEVKIIS